MLIGQDFEKIEFNFLGYDFLEPNALYGDVIVGALSVYFAILCSRYYKQTNLIFFKHWKHFFYVFGIGFAYGGFGHFCYNYWGISGKIPAWYVGGIISTIFIELAMASLLRKELYKKLVRFFIIKTLFICVIQALVIIFIDLEKEPGIGLIGSILAALTAFPFVLGVLGARFSKMITPSFKYLWWSLVIFAPSLLFQAMKINFHQWFDRNDVSHILMFVNILFYFFAARGYYRFQTNSKRAQQSMKERGSIS
ncbi:MAG: hypothetical protein HRT58_15930 [Crocinitomicaceae bacterium]|nr:hypothetical protein [Flavobacteriales bacterium]NQZ37159.1 hypothetical protein [Crocinitomicaceae bacterium]